MFMLIFYVYVNCPRTRNKKVVCLQEDHELGSMLELCWKGTREVKLGDSGEVRKFLKVSQQP